MRDRTVLDLGCGDGGFLLALRRQGMNVFGVECDSKKVDRLHDLGVDVRHARIGAEDVFLSESRKYDLISLRSSFYYFHDPLCIFRRLGTMLSDDGMLYLKSHLITSLFYRKQCDCSIRFGRNAVILPTKNSILYLLTRSGFTMLDVRYYPENVPALLGLKMPGIPAKIANPVLQWFCHHVLDTGDRVVCLAQARETT